MRFSCASSRHSFALELAGWIIPCEWLQTRHYVCANPPCCRPSHLKIGTPKENIEDRDSQGRQAHGENQGAAKLNPAKVQEIRLAAAGGASKMGLGRRFGIDRTTVRDIINRKIWKHVV